MSRQGLIRNMVTAAGDLVMDMAAEIEAAGGEPAAAFSRALQNGERPVLVLELDDSKPKIRLALINDYQNLRHVMVIEGNAPPAVHQ